MLISLRLRENHAKAPKIFGNHQFKQSSFALWGVATPHICVIQRTRHRVYYRTIMDFKPPFHLGIEFYLFVSHGGMNDRGSTCKFRNARIYSLYLYFIKIVSFWLWNIRFFNTQEGGIQNSHRNSRLIRHGKGFIEESMSKLFYAHSSRKHWKCKY